MACRATRVVCPELLPQMTARRLCLIYAASESATEMLRRPQWNITKECTHNAPASYGKVEKAYDELIANGRSVTEADIEKMADAAMNLRFDMRTDYQQDKVIPCWNRSAHPGDTFFMSNETHFLHILCMHFCGHESGVTRFSRNIIYSRSEEVCGAKTSGDTLSTITDALLGAREPKLTQPPFSRTGYNKDRKIE